MRVLYVAATRAEDHLIFSGAVERKKLKQLGDKKTGQWLAWLWQALELNEHSQSEVKEVSEHVRIDVRIERRAGTEPLPSAPTIIRETAAKAIDVSRPFAELFPLLQPITPERGQVLRRFSVTQLINFQRCARQYYFDRMLRAPIREELAVWNDAEAPEPPANLTATLKGAVIHRFCETFREGDDTETRLRGSFDEVLSQREAELAGRAFDIDKGEAVRALMPLAENYLASDVFRRVSEFARINADDPHSALRTPHSSPGLWSELRFRLRRPLGILTGTIDKLLITPSVTGGGVDVEIIDFKTNRFSAPSRRTTKKARRAVATVRTATVKAKISEQPAQGAFDFESVAEKVVAEDSETLELEVIEPTVSIWDQIETVSRDYQLQMQSYALALRELLPATVEINRLRATLHFIDPNVEVAIPSPLLDQEICARAIDDAMDTIASLDGTLDAEQFPPVPATHCRICNFRDLCPAGRDWLRQN